jgi:hypothetical protein
VAEVGEEEGVDELALAARVLRHERDGEALGGEAPLEVRQARGGMLVQDACHDGPAPERRELRDHRVAPLLVLGEPALEGTRSRGPRAGCAQR